MKPRKDFIKDYLKLNSEEESSQANELNNMVVTKEVKKGTILLREGDPASKYYFVKKGLLRAYTLDSKGKEHIYAFAPERWLISDSQAIVFDSPSALYIDALEDSEIEIIDKREYAHLNIPSEGMKRIIVALRQRMALLQKRVIMLLSAPAIERYNYFIDTFPDITQRVPQRMIASYLGVTPEALSKIRGQMAHSTSKK